MKAMIGNYMLIILPRMHHFAQILKSGIHYTTLAMICSLGESMLVAKSKSQSADSGQSKLTDLTENHIVTFLVLFFPICFHMFLL